MILDKMILDDFLTYDHLEHVFEKRPLQVQGLNLTDDKQKTNGTGKSGLPTGVEFCITASNSRGVRDNELVTYGKKTSRAQLFASCDVRKQSLHIDWLIKVKGSNVLTLATKEYGSDEWTTVSFSNVNDGKKFILAWFAISKEDLFNYYIINKTRFKSFFQSSNKEKVDLINRFSDASIIQGLEDIDTEKLEESFREAEKQVNEAEGAISTLNNQIEREEARDFKAEMAEDINDIEIEIKEIKENITVTTNQKAGINIKVDAKLLEIKGIKEDIVTATADKKDIEREIIQMNKNIDSVKDEVKTAQKSVDTFKTTDWDNERKDYEGDIKVDQKILSTERAEKQKWETKETKIAKLLSQLEVKLQGVIQCPKCNHEWMQDEDLDTLLSKKAQAKNLKPAVDKEIENAEDSIQKIKDGIAAIEVSVSGINKKEQTENSKKNVLSTAVNQINIRLTTVLRKLTKLKGELTESQNDLTNYDTDIKNLEQKIENIKASEKNFDSEIVNYKKEIKNYKAQIKGLKLDDNKDRIKELQKDLDEIQKNKVVFESEVSKIGDVIYERNQWVNNFKQFRMFLANQSLEVIEYHMNRYLHGMGSDLRVNMEGFRLLADGTPKEEITAKIVRGQERTFASFSGGEQGRLLFASILANRHMINEAHPYGGLDFLSIDEVFEGVDSLGLKHLIESAKELGITVMIITHVTDEEASSDTILVIKENGISRIEKQ